MQGQTASVIPLDSAKEQKSSQEKSVVDEVLFQGIPVGAPSMPKHVTGAATTHWKYMVKLLKEAGVLAKIDQGTLANLCLYYAKAKEAQETIVSEGTETQLTTTGYQQPTVASMNFKTYSSLYNKLADKFLMNPAVRQKVKLENPNQGALDLD